MTVATPKSLRRQESARARKARIARRVAAVAGAAGAAVAGEADAAPLTYVPTPGVVAAQGIPGFSFTAPTTVTSGTLRPPASFGIGEWDIDGNGISDFGLVNYLPNLPMAFLVPATSFTPNANGLLAVPELGDPLRNLAGGAAVGPLATRWWNSSQAITYNRQNRQSFFTLNEVGYIGFRFAFGDEANDYYYGWASLTIDGADIGRGFTIGEAFYQSTPNTAINVGAVPVPVPEPSSMALLAAGAAGVTAWRARRKKQPAAE